MITSRPDSRARQSALASPSLRLNRLGKNTQAAACWLTRAQEASRATRGPEALVPPGTETRHVTVPNTTLRKRNRGQDSRSVRSGQRCATFAV
eukprot:642759-Rhodomonas_salina.2